MVDTHTSPSSALPLPSSPPQKASPPPSGAWCPVFHPTRDEFASFATYIRTVVEPQCAHIGICKVVPPDGWFSRSYDLDALERDCAVTAPVSQHVAGKKGIFNVDLVERKSLSVRAFAALAATLSTATEPAATSDSDTIERQFWKSLRPTMDAPVYGADIVSSLFPAAADGDDDTDTALSWNLNRLDTILKHRIDLPGVTRAMLYFGMWRTMFAFHTEDMDLYSINYLHVGKPKFWYAVPPQYASQLERAAQSMFSEKHHACAQFLRHKTSLISPTRLKEFGVPFYKAFHQPGEFVITFPATYHEGFNVGFNIAEAVNFASPRWIPFGLKAKVCKCSPDSVRIDMDTFLTRLMDDVPGSDKHATLGDGAWVFSCKCGEFYSSDDATYAVENQWFECSQCKIWAHLACVHADLAHCKSDELPHAILCHRCSVPLAALPSAALASPLATTSKRRRTLTKTQAAPSRKPTTAKSATTSTATAALKSPRRQVLGKRSERSSTPSDAASDSDAQSPRASSPPTTASAAQTPPPKRRSRTATTTSNSSATTPTKRRASVRKSQFAKGSTIIFTDAEAKVVAVEGNMIRVHYKGQSVDDDEWLPMSSRDLRARIVSIAPPRPVRTKAAK